MRGGPRAALGVALLSIFGYPRAAQATLSEDALRVEAAWRTSGLVVERRAPIYLEQGRVRRVLLPEGGGECVSVAILGPRASSLVARPLAGPGPLPTVSRPQSSESGMIAFSRCGDERDTVSALVLELRTPRAAVEVIVAVGNQPAPEPVDALPERAGARVRPPSDPGRPPTKESFEARVALAERRAKAEGAFEASRSPASSNEDGQGRALVALAAGCYRLELLAESGHGVVADIDAELRDVATGQTLIRDRSDTPDARLELCTGEPLATQIFFGGAAPRSKLVLVQSRWALPGSLPATWGLRARAAMAMAFWRRKTVAPAAPPLVQLTGVGGSTTSPIEIEPGSCYLTVVGVGRGELRSLALSALLEGRALHDEASGSREGAALAFCSREATNLPLSIEARGTNLLWGLSLWRVGPTSLREAEAGR